MFLSKLVKTFFISLLLLLPAAMTHAATAQFDQKQFDLPVSFSTTVAAPFIRNDFSLLDLVKSTVSGEPLNHTQTLLSDETLTAISQIQTSIDQKSQNAQLVIADNKAQTFNPGTTGQALDLYALDKTLLSSPSVVDLPVLISPPETSLSQTNTMGINELIATGVSDFKNSPKNRIHNIDVGADKFNGIIIAQGEEFSFNKYLGDVDKAHGFLPELVIKATGVLPEYGGGLCQVSSTAFRAAMNAGVPITARRNHSFAVSYYAPQGTDATIYPGSADLKFINNMPSPILVRTRIEGTKLYFDFYGTKDDRTVAFEGPVQYDRKPDGSLKATWTRHVTQNGVTTTQVFNSTYLSPSLFEPTPAAATPPPTPVAMTPTIAPLTQ